ncbi:ABC transporter substrate-binding protein [Knoellia sp. CPCC 206453]|uniref:ABC transporter substrate-binding protein n=1 Tax=Knoellia pratensis TaxID=3404796 RepID=UPI00361B9263
MTFKRKATPFAVLTVAALALTACAQSDRKDSDSGSGTGSGGTSTFTFGAAGAPKVFDPFYATDGETFRVTRQIFEGLVGIKEGSAEVEPELAEKWEPDASGTNWTFTLRTGVKFSDGEPFNADAVCKNFERMFDQNKDGQVAAEYWSGTFGAFKDKAAESLYKGCEVKDEKTVVLSVTRPTSAFPTFLSLDSLSMQSPKAMDAGKANDVVAQGEGFTYPAYSKSGVGTGPYTLEKYDEANKTVTLKRNDNYWGEKAKNAKVVFKIVPDESTRRQELEAKSINGYDLPNPADWKGLESAGNKVEIRPAFNVFYLGLNPIKNPKLADLKVRKAIYMALNREQLVKTQLPEGATVATQMMPDTVSGYNKSLQAVKYDPTAAKALLKEAGAEGMALTFAYPSEVSRPYMPNPQKLHQAMAADLEAIGIKVNVVTKPWNGGYLDGVDANAYDAFLLGWTGDFDSAANFIGTFFGSLDANNFGLAKQSFGPTLAADLAKADSTVDEAQRTAAYEKLNQQIQEEYLPALAISHSPPALVVGEGVEGIVASPLTAEEFSGVTVGGK